MCNSAPAEKKYITIPEIKVGYEEVKEVINNDYCFDSVLTICEETNTVVQRYLHLRLREGGHRH